MAYNDPYTQANQYPPFAPEASHLSGDGRGYPPADDRYEDTLTSQHRGSNKYGQPNYGVPEKPVRQWRREQYAGMWTRGGRGRCCLRFCGCSFLTFIFLLLSILLTLIMYIRPPNITINNAGLATNGSAVQVTSSSLNLNLAANISVENPNYFAVSFKKVQLTLTYPVNNTNVGGGEQDNIVFHSKSQTTFTFPITLTYNESQDPNRAVLQDLLAKCGITGGQKQDITVSYKVVVGIRVLFVTISPTVSNKFSFACPVTASDLSSLLKGTGINLSNLTG